jgi:tRNA(Ile)-lysidine synthase
MLLEQLEEIIRQRNMLKDGDVVILGLSGGMDSVCLFHLLRQMKETHGYRLVAVHLNHGLRVEADADEAFVTELCRIHGIELISEKRDIRGLAHVSGMGIEEQARHERYLLFEEIRKEYGAYAIVLAHHREDQVETVLHHLIRGSALRGLGGMRHKRDWIIRPLLSIGKAELKAYMLAGGYDWVEDETNKDLIYTRNRLRHQILPLLRAINPSVDEQLLQTSLLLQEDEKTLEALSQVWIRKYATFYGVLGVTMSSLDWEAAPFSFRARFYQQAYLRLTGRGLEKKYVFLLENQLQERKVVDLPGGIFAKVSKGHLIVGSKVRSKIPYQLELELPGEKELAIGMTLRARLVESAVYFGLSEEERGSTISFYADLQKLGEKLVLRNRTTKDAYRMFASVGESTVKKLFSGLGLGAYASQNLPVICSLTGKIVWVAGGRIRQEYRVTKETKEIVHVELFSH